MKAQTSTEFLIIVSIILVILIISASIMFDIPSVISNLKDSSTNRYLESGDIWVLSHSFNSNNGILILKNNVDSVINLSVSINEIKISSGLVMNPSERVKINFTHSEEVLNLYFFDLVFEYINLENGNTYGYSASISGESS